MTTITIPPSELGKPGTLEAMLQADCVIIDGPDPSDLEAAENQAWQRLVILNQKRKAASAKLDRAFARLQKCQRQLAAVEAEYQSAKTAWESAIDADMAAHPEKVEEIRLYATGPNLDAKPAATSLPGDDLAAEDVYGYGRPA